MANKKHQLSQSAVTATLQAFIDSLIRYVMDPAQWDALLAEMEKLGENIEFWDPTELLGQLSRAESLSWRLKQEAGDLSSSQFAYVLLDEHDNTTGCSDNIHLLSDYLLFTNIGRKLTFADKRSQISFAEAKMRLAAKARGHILVELSNSKSNRHRYGYLVAEHEFPHALKIVANGATRALLIAQDQPSKKLAQIVRESFGLTSAETALTLNIATGMTLRETAEDLDISINTARNHLQSVFAKSGINRQGDLVLVTTQLSVILAATDGDIPSAAPESPSPIAQTLSQHFMILADGRRLAYRTYGDPLGSPVVYLHESMGSSRLPAGTDDEARRRGLYMVAFERPGFGFSDACDYYSFDSVANDQRQLLDHLRIRNCSVLGLMSGGAYALVFANKFPERVARLLLASARPPSPAKGKSNLLQVLRTTMVRQPWILSTFFNILRNRSSQETNASLINSVYGSVPHDHEFLLANPEMLNHMIVYTMESMAVTVAGAISELMCFAAKPGYDLNALQCPITAWHGSADRLAPLADLQRVLGPKISETRIFKGAGSLLMLEHWHAVLDELAAFAQSEAGVPRA